MRLQIIQKLDDHAKIDLTSHLQNDKASTGTPNSSLFCHLTVAVSSLLRYYSTQFVRLTWPVIGLSILILKQCHNKVVRKLHNLIAPNYVNNPEKPSGKYDTLSSCLATSLLSPMLQLFLFFHLQTRKSCTTSLYPCILIRFILRYTAIDHWARVPTWQLWSK